VTGIWAHKHFGISRRLGTRGQLANWKCPLNQRVYSDIWSGRYWKWCENHVAKVKWEKWKSRT